MSSPTGNETAQAMAQEDAFGRIFHAELANLRPETPLPEIYSLTDLHRMVGDLNPPLAALCLSGGGIRSAAFALGILQSLAKGGLLWKFDYLSTVSGGGYIGSFLSAWRHHAGDEAVQRGLDRSDHASGREAAEINGLRASSNYLTPRLGVLSADTWTALALIVRNIVLNWLVFLPFFMGVLFVPRFCRDVLQGIAGKSAFWGWCAVGLGAILICAGLACASYGRRHTAGKWLTNGRFLIFVLLPVAASSIFFTAAAALFSPAPAETLVMGAVTGGGCYVLAWLAAGFCRPQHDHNYPSESVAEIVTWAISGAISGAMLTVGLRLGASLDVERNPEPLAVLGICWTMLSIFSGELIYVGLRSGSRRGDMDREWLARAAGWLCAAAASCATIFAVALYGPMIRFSPVMGGAGLLSGVVAIGLGQSARTAATTAMALFGRPTLSQIASAAAIIFALFLAVAVSWLDSALASSWGRPSAFLDLLVGVPLIGLSALVSYFVNVNRFSLHGLYRNRLMRTFLGSPRQCATAESRSRSPDPFTGFDPDDNVRIKDLPKKRLLQIVNVALNIVSTKNLAWQERRAESFTLSPLHAGNPLVGYRPAKDFGGEMGGMSLGTAMAISGAAVSPNMGYHSSPLLAFLLMLFNVRLGCWLGNPAGQDYRRDGPRVGLWTMLQELASQTTQDGNWIYLSDGGHFDNLGLYEMIRRRCRFIVVSDAGCDPLANLADLGDAVRKVSIDFGVDITFDQLDVAAVARPPQSAMYCWTGSIRYPNSNVLGWVLYIRPGYNGDETVDIRSYASANPTFPHESTLEQWFGESQFEAYRALGQHQMDKICGLSAGEPRPAHTSLQSLRDGAETYAANDYVLAPGNI